MKVLVTGSSGHLGEALMRTLPECGHDPVGLDVVADPGTRHHGTLLDRTLVRRALREVDAVVHTATLHKPHVATHTKKAFVETNVSGTLVLLEEAATAGIRGFVFTSTTSTYGNALSPAPGAPAAWIDETVTPVPRNIYGVTKTAAEDLCALFARNHGIAAVVLRVARFFPEADDDGSIRATFSDANVKANEFLYRRVDLEDAAVAHECALRKSPDIGFGKYIVSATSPFGHDDLTELRVDPRAVVKHHFPEFERIYHQAGFRMFPEISRVYSNRRARGDLGWNPRYDFARILRQIEAGSPIGSDLARAIGIKGYHAQRFEGVPYPAV